MKTEAIKNWLKKEMNKQYGTANLPMRINLPTDHWIEILERFGQQIAQKQREHDLNEIEDERGNKELETAIRAIKWNIRNSPLVI